MASTNPQQPEMLHSNYPVSQCHYMILLRTKYREYSVCFTKTESQAESLAEGFKQLRDSAEVIVFSLTQSSHHLLRHAEVWISDKD